MLVAIDTATNYASLALHDGFRLRRNTPGTRRAGILWNSCPAW